MPLRHRLAEFATLAAQSVFLAALVVALFWIAGFIEFVLLEAA
jgi:hypothetical protein